MARKLIALVSTHGKTNEMIKEEAWTAFKKYQILAEKKLKTPPISRYPNHARPAESISPRY